MGTGILICGMNGSGKSTLGKALAERINFRFIDNENLYFKRSTSNEPYGNGRTKEEVIRLLMEEVSIRILFLLPSKEITDRIFYRCITILLWWKCRGTSVWSGYETVPI